MDSEKPKYIAFDSTKQCWIDNNNNEYTKEQARQVIIDAEPDEAKKELIRAGRKIPIIKEGNPFD
jgi:hypothetical protein